MISILRTVRTKLLILRPVTKWLPVFKTKQSILALSKTIETVLGILTLFEPGGHKVAPIRRTHKNAFKTVQLKKFAHTVTKASGLFCISCASNIKKSKTRESKIVTWSVYS